MKSLLISLQRWWLLLLLFLIPFSLRYLTKEPFAISYLNLLSVGFIALGSLNALLGYIPFRGIRHKPFLLLLGVVLLALAYALFFTDPLRSGIGLWTSRLTQPMLVGFFAYQLFEHRLVSYRSCMWALFGSLLALVFVGGLQSVGVIPYRDPGRITATYFYPNTAARYFISLLLMTLPWILFGHVKQKRLMLGLWLLGFLLVLTTKSYNGVVSLGAGLVMLLLLLPRPFQVFKRVALMSLVIIALVIVVNAPKLPKWETSIRDSRLTRLEFWDVAMHVIQDNFWTGIGIKTWELTYPKLVETYGPFPPLNWGSVQPHNVFLDSFVKAGLPGFFAITAFMLWPILEGWVVVKRAWKQKASDWWLGLSVAAFGLSMLTFGLIDDPLWSDDAMPFRFIVLFMMVSFVQRLESKR